MPLSKPKLQPKRDRTYRVQSPSLIDQPSCADCARSYSSHPSNPKRMCMIHDNPKSVPKVVDALGICIVHLEKPK